MSHAISSKACTKCGETKPLDGFPADRSRRGGRRAQCRDCRNRYLAGYREANRDDIRDYHRRCREDNAEHLIEYITGRVAAGVYREHYRRNREKALEYHRQYREENAERRRAIRRQWYRDNREASIEYARRYRRENPDRVSEYNHRRKARKLPAKGDHTAEQVAARRALYGNRCWLCGGEQAEAGDHVIPLAEGGSNYAANIRPAHASCNASKGAKRMTMEQIRELTRRAFARKGMLP